MRENRTYGSEGGEGEGSSLPLSFLILRSRPNPTSNLVFRYQVGDAFRFDAFDAYRVTP